MSWGGVLLVLGVMAPQDDAEAVRAHVADLAGPQRDDALAALAVAPAELAVPALTECLASQAPDHAWQARRALRRVGSEADPRERVWRDAIKGLAELVADEATPADRRVIVALTLGELGETAKGAADELAEQLEATGSLKTPVAAAVGLAGIGESARSELRKCLRGGKHSRAMFLAIVAFASMGEEAETSQKELLQVVKKKGSLATSVVSRAALYAASCAGASETACAKAWRKREELEEGRVWGGGGGALNYGAPVGVRYRMAVDWLLWQLERRLSLPSNELSLPQGEGRGLARADYFTVADLLRDLMHHLAIELRAVRTELDDDSLASWTDWQDRTRAVFGTCELIWMIAPVVK